MNSLQSFIPLEKGFNPPLSDQLFSILEFHRFLRAGGISAFILYQFVVLGKKTHVPSEDVLLHLNSLNNWFILLYERFLGELLWKVSQFLVDNFYCTYKATNRNTLKILIL